MITISGLGDDAPGAAATPTADGFLLVTPSPSSSDVASYLQTYAAGSDRDGAAQALLAKGVPQETVSAALNWLATSARFRLNKNQIYGWLAVVSAAASAFHGYRRNKSIGWSAVWFLMGGIFPVFTPVVALAQGFGKPKGA